jgi:CTP:molybdopterin cytidylyltransferase MocA
LLLAAGSGRRYGRPKALVDTGDGPWVLRALAALAGRDPIAVVVGAGADEVTSLLPAGVLTVRNEDFALGMGSSLRAGLLAMPDDVDAAVVMLVDLPDVGDAVVGRLVAAAAEPIGAALMRAGYGGRPGHPVLLGREHWPGVLASATGDQGARRYLADHEARVVECGDLATGTDIDRPGAS